MCFYSKVIGKGFDPMPVVLHAEQGEMFTGVGRVWDAAGFGGSSLYSRSFRLMGV